MVRVGSVKNKTEQDEQEEVAAAAARTLEEERQQQQQNSNPAVQTFSQIVNQGGVNGNQLVQKLLSSLSDGELQKQAPVVNMYENMLGSSMEDILAKAFLKQLEEKEAEQRRAAEETAAMKELILQALQQPGATATQQPNATSLLTELVAAQQQSSAASLASNSVAPSTAHNTVQSRNTAAAAAAPVHLQARRAQQEAESFDFMRAAAERLARAQGSVLEDDEQGEQEDEEPVREVLGPPTTRIAFPNAPSVQNALVSVMSAISQNSFPPLPPQNPQPNAQFGVSPQDSIHNLQSMLLGALAKNGSNNNCGNPSMVSQSSSNQYSGNFAAAFSSQRLNSIEQGLALLARRRSDGGSLNGDVTPSQRTRSIERGLAILARKRSSTSSSTSSRPAAGSSIEQGLALLARKRGSAPLHLGSAAQQCLSLLSSVSSSKPSSTNKRRIPNEIVPVDGLVGNHHHHHRHEFSKKQRVATTTTTGESTWHVVTEDNLQNSATSKSPTSLSWNDTRRAIG